MKYHLNSNVFIQENAFENIVCEMAAILSRPQCVNTNTGLHYDKRKLPLKNIRGSYLASTSLNKKECQQAH